MSVFQVLLRSEEIRKVAMIGEDIEFGETKEIVSPGFESTEDGSELLITNGVVDFGRRKRTRVIGDRMPEIVDRIALSKDSATGVETCIGFNTSLSIGVEMSENGSRCECLFETTEGSNGVGRELEWVIVLSRELRQRLGKLGVVLDASARVVTEAKECLQFGERGRRRPVDDCGDAFGEH